MAVPVPGTAFFVPDPEDGNAAAVESGNGGRILTAIVICDRSAGENRPSGRTHRWSRRSGMWLCRRGFAGDLPARRGPGTALALHPLPKGGENQMRNQKGFTLIELLIVVAIIGIIA